MARKIIRTSPPWIGSRQYRILEEISAGDLFVGFLFSARSTKAMYSIARERAKERYQNKRAVLKLKGANYVREVKTNGASSFFITREGKLALRQLYVHAQKATQHPERWDGRWRVVSYDFPEQERSARNSLRYILERSQFKQIQKSVWLSPYNSTMLEELIVRNDTVKKRTLCMVVKSITDEALFKKHFHLK